MTLRQKQSRFAHMVALLILHAEQLGYELTFGDAYRDARVSYGLASSLHRQRLAIDLNLFKDGRFLQATADHEPLGHYWEAIGGCWGGRFRDPDGNHYSLEHGGVK
jgi:hypothetical protein